MIINVNDVSYNVKGQIPLTESVTDAEIEVCKKKFKADTLIKNQTHYFFCDIIQDATILSETNNDDENEPKQIEETNDEASIDTPDNG